MNKRSEYLMTILPIMICFFIASSLWSAVRNKNNYATVRNVLKMNHHEKKATIAQKTSVALGFEPTLIYLHFDISASFIGESPLELFYK